MREETIMQTKQGIAQTKDKLRRFVKTLDSRQYQPIATVETRFCQTGRQHRMPEDAQFGPMPEDMRWGGEGAYGWFKGTFTVPEALDGRALYLWPKTKYYEAMLWLNGEPHGIFTPEEPPNMVGLHFTGCITTCARAGETLELVLECYAFHDMPGTMPFAQESFKDYTYPIGPMDVCTRDEEFAAFQYDLQTLLELTDVLPETDFRRAEVDNALCEAHRRLLYDPASCSDADFRAALRDAHPLLLDQLEKRNAGTTAFVGLTGHSHMDTAWLWPIAETEKKCARTFANQLNLMEQYDEYRFIQSSAYHADIIRREYPGLFRRIAQAVREGRWEPNGGVWVECDCNLTGGEYMIRQFLWGQRFTREHFGYTSDCFWLPDTFGYAYALPQIIKGCGVNYFLTTKMDWNDTTRFPYTSFYWQALDGTQVLTHLNRIERGPSPIWLEKLTTGGEKIKEPWVSNMRLHSYGHGDGGGGPHESMIEMSRRVRDLQGVARSEYISVSAFMQRLEETIVRPTVYADELYLEGHRGTLTNQHQIKRNNRKAEIALHDLELALVLRAVQAAVVADGEAIRPLMNDLLVRQFHDILPGTCIHAAHAEALAVVGNVIRSAGQMTQEMLGTSGGGAALYNTLGFPREDTLYLPAKAAGVAGAKAQRFSSLDGEALLAVSGLALPALGTQALSYTDAPCGDASPFTLKDDRLQTPFAEIRFDQNGFIASMTDRRTGRELVQGLPFNTFLMAEDIPAKWDAWDVDADLHEKFRPCATLVSREVIADGPVELRIRSTYRLTELSTITQDMVFDAASPMISFDTVMDWQEEHRFLKTAFDTALLCDGARSEIQFGHIRRSNRRSTDAEKARHEVCNHKFTDLSEASYGIALLNDCKYGLSVSGGSMRLSLHKGGMRPDKEGDKGIHRCRYAVLPHAAPFGAQSVIRPAYAFNYAPIVIQGGAAPVSLAAIDRSNIVIEAVKPCEDAARAYIVRLYEAMGDYTTASMTFGHPVTSVQECNMLEEEQAAADARALTFRPFEIKTIKVHY